MPRKSPALADPAQAPGLDRITLPRRGSGAVRMDARLLDEVTWAAPDAEGGAMRLRLWKGRSKLAVEVVVTVGDSPVLDAATAPGIDGIADWLETLDPWAAADGTPHAPPAFTLPGFAAALWDEAARTQWRDDFRWLVGEALFRWQGVDMPCPAAMETTA